MTNTNEESASVPPSRPTENCHEFFRRRLRELGSYEPESNYHGAIGPAVEALSATFASQGHSDGSAFMTRGLFEQLMKEWEADIQIPPPEAQAPPETAAAQSGKEFNKALIILLNRYSMETASNTPDFILAGFLAGCLAIFNQSVIGREKWYGHSHEPGQP